MKERDEEKKNEFKNKGWSGEENVSGGLLLQQNQPLCGDEKFFISMMDVLAKHNPPRENNLKL